MQRALLIALIFLLPASTLAASAPASFSVARSLLAASSSPGNAYRAGISVVITAPVAGDLSVTGGSVVTAAPVHGDELVLAGSISSRARVTGDVRFFGGRINIEEQVGGDIIAFGFSVHDSGRADGSVFIGAIDTSLTNGAIGPVTLYGNTVSLAGDFASDVTVITSGHLTLAASTTILGTLSYEAPEPAAIPASATIIGGVKYTNASYLPDASTSRILALVSIGFFLFVRVLGALILAGLLAGLFPKLAEAIAERAYTKQPRAILLTMLLGFATLVATPILLILLSLTFVGIGLALLIFFLYALVAFLALLYAGIFLGSVFARRFARRDTMLWHDGVIGMLLLSLISLVPFIGLFAVLLLTTFSAGALLQLFFNFAFPREEQTPEML
ncbi:hypothetical protein CO131_02280 [Candidatus Kaiserbacteria bacterium CG_4_9_14_3_um_filter_50_16]|nr:MAG: hypothetical protein CO131_02280 [Candidatus Kaiserbacteria bacterium CG_4_9_14_3_um_filter_50_16]